MAYNPNEFLRLKHLDEFARQLRNSTAAPPLSPHARLLALNTQKP